MYQGNWHPGKQEVLVDRATWDRVQVLLGEKVYRSHEMTFASELITCGYCGRPITGERKTKMTKTGEREYFYYRCTRYNVGDHPRVRIIEGELDRQVLELFKQIQIDDEKIRGWIVGELRLKTQKGQVESRKRIAELQRQHSLLAQQHDRLVNMRLADEISAEEFAAKKTEFRDRESRIALDLEACSRGRHEEADIAVKAFELSQSLAEKWLAADYGEKRLLLEIVCLNFTLDGVTLVPTMRKPFDILAKGLLVSSNRGDWI